MSDDVVIRTAYGLDLSGDRLLVCRGQAGRRPAFERAADLDLRSPASAEAIGRLLAEASSGRAAVAVCLPLHDSFARWMQAPFPSLAKARRVLPSLLDVQLPFPLERCVYDLPVLQSAPGGRSEALAVAALEESVAAFLARLKAHGVDPDILDHEGLALWSHALAELPPAPDVVRAVAYLGEDRTSLAIGRGDRFQSAHAIRAGARDLAPGGAEPEAALRSLGLRIRQAVLAQVPEEDRPRMQWLWAGPGAARGGLVQDVHRAAGLAAPPQDPALKDPAWILARACAARALAHGTLPCNLRAGALEHPRAAERRSARKRRAALACLAAGLALCAVNAAWLGLLGLRKGALHEEVAAAARELAGGARVPRGQEVVVAERALADRSRSVAPFTATFAPSRAALLSDMLRVCRQGGLEVGSASIQPGAVEVAGRAADWTACEALVRFLEGQGWIVSEPRRTDAGEDERVHFVVKAAQP
jgi:hypothetical protein